MSTDLAHYDFNLDGKVKKNSLKKILGMEVELVGKSLNIFTPENKFRVLCSNMS